MRTINIGLVGFGTVGVGVARILCDNADHIAERTGMRLVLKTVVDTDLSTERDVQLPDNVLTDDLGRITDDPDIHVAVELVGGTTIARTIIEQMLRASKPVVTANKALLAHHGAELFALAAECGVSINFEASCVGGVPIIGAIRDGLIANQITSLHGIVNGTCNHILTAMEDRGETYEQALADAVAAGIAETPPDLDVQGIDSAHKLTILASLAFGKTIPFESVHVEGIDGIQLVDLQFALEFGYRLKLLAIGGNTEEGISCRVHPAFVSKQDTLAWVSGTNNAVTISGDATGRTLYYGHGAGQMPTASAVVSDIVDIAQGRSRIWFDQLRLLPGQTPAAKLMPIEKSTSRYYLRLTVMDEPGVMGSVTGILGGHDVSIGSILQHERELAGRTPIVIMTHNAVEGNLRNAVKEIDQLDATTEKTIVIRVLAEE